MVAPQSLRRAVLVMSATSFLVPAVGVITAPILARALGTDGRGALAAAMAPAALILGVATLGLPDALTYYLAKDPGRTRRAIVGTGLVTALLGVVCVGLAAVSASFFAGGDETLASLIVVAAALTAPALVVNVLRGAAAGRQEWGLIAGERVATSVLRVAALVILLLVGHLNILTALLVLLVGPIVSALPYSRLLRRSQVPPIEDPSRQARLKPMLSYGSRLWFGGVASMLLSRSDQLLMVPLSSTAELGLFIVANTIADVPIVVSLAVQSAVFGVNSRDGNALQVAATSRVVTFLAFMGCGVLALTLPLWLAPLFGTEFTGAAVPTLLLMLGSIICIPSLIAAAGIAAWGRPGMRSIALLITFAFNLVVLLALVPSFGAVGAAATSVLSNTLLTVLMVAVAARLMKVSPWAFIGIRRSDFLLMWSELGRGARLLTRRNPWTEQRVELVADDHSQEQGRNE